MTQTASSVRNNLQHLYGENEQLIHQLNDNLASILSKQAALGADYRPKLTQMIQQMFVPQINPPLLKTLSSAASETIDYEALYYARLEKSRQSGQQLARLAAEHGDSRPIFCITALEQKRADLRAAMEQKRVDLREERI